MVHRAQPLAIDHTRDRLRLVFPSGRDRRARFRSGACDRVLGSDQSAGLGALRERVSRRHVDGVGAGALFRARKPGRGVRSALPARDEPGADGGACEGLVSPHACATHPLSRLRERVRVRGVLVLTLARAERFRSAPLRTALTPALSRKRERGKGMRDRGAQRPAYESRSVTVRLNTGLPRACDRAGRRRNSRGARTARLLRARRRPAKARSHAAHDALRIGVEMVA